MLKYRVIIVLPLEATICAAQNINPSKEAFISCLRATAHINV